MTCFICGMQGLLRGDSERPTEISEWHISAAQLDSRSKEMINEHCQMENHCMTQTARFENGIRIKDWIGTISNPRVDLPFLLFRNGIL